MIWYVLIIFAITHLAAPTHACIPIYATTYTYISINRGRGQHQQWLPLDWPSPRGCIVNISTLVYNVYIIHRNWMPTISADVNIQRTISHVYYTYIYRFPAYKVSRLAQALEMDSSDRCIGTWLLFISLKWEWIFWSLS